MSYGWTRRIRRAAIALSSISSLVFVGLVAAPAVSNADPQLTVEQARSKVEKLRQDALAAGERSNQAKVSVKKLDRQLTQMGKESERQQRKVEKLQSKVGQFANEQYRSGGIDPTLELMLSSDPEEFLDGLGTARAYSSQMESAVTNLQAEQKSLKEKRAAEKAERARLHKAKVDADKELETAEAKTKSAERVLNQLTAEQREQVEEQDSDTGQGDGGGSGDGGEDIPIPPGSGKGATALAYAKQKIGSPYVFGASGPGQFDCSGLTMAAWSQAGVSLPHSAKQQYAMGPKVPRSALKPGDIVYFYSPISHNGLYVGGNTIVHAPRPGKSVELTGLDVMPFAGATRPA